MTALPVWTYNTDAHSRWTETKRRSSSQFNKVLYKEYKVSQNIHVGTKPRGIEQTQAAVGTVPFQSSRLQLNTTYHARLIGDDDVEQSTATTMKDLTSGVTGTIRNRLTTTPDVRFFSHRRQITTTTASTAHRRTLNTELRYTDGQWRQPRVAQATADNITTDSIVLLQTWQHYSRLILTESRSAVE